MARDELVQSVLRGLEILEVVARSEEGLSVGQIAESLGLKRPTARNLARSLAARGYLSSVAEPTRYRPGPAIQELWSAAQAHGIERRVEAALKNLQQHEPSLSFVFSRLVGDELRVIQRIDSTRRGVVRRPAADTLHPYDSATALVVHAFASDQTSRELRERYPFVSYAGRLYPSLERFEAEVLATQTRGLAEPPDLEGVRLFRAAAPVFGPDQELLGVLGVSTNQSLTDADRRRLIARLAEQAQALSRSPHEALT